MLRNVILLVEDNADSNAATRGPCQVPDAPDVDPTNPTTPGATSPCSTSSGPGTPTTPTIPDNCPIPPDPLDPCIPDTPDTGGTTSGAVPHPGDLAIFDAENGFAYNGTGASQDGSGNTAPLGRELVAVSADGTTVASLGVDTKGGGGTGLKLYYQRAPAGARFTPATTASNVSLFLYGAPAGVLVSADGSRVVVGISGGELGIRGFLDAFADLRNAHVTLSLEDGIPHGARAGIQHLPAPVHRCYSARVP